MGPRDALRASWLVSGRRIRAGFWISIVSGLLGLPAATIVSVLTPLTSTSGAGVTAPDPLLAAVATLTGGLLQALALPVTGLALGFAYRRLRLGDPTALPIPEPPPARQRVAWSVAGGALLVGLLGYGVMTARSFQAGLSSSGLGTVLGGGAPGTITVGTGPPTGLVCQADGAAMSVRVGTSLSWTANLRDPVTAAADGELALIRNGQQLFRSPLGLGTDGGTCLSGSEPLAGLEAGTYRIQVFVDGGLEATGDFTVAP